MKLGVVIIEDVHENIETLSLLLDQNEQDVNIIGTADNLRSAKELLLSQAQDIDLAFLDIQLKEGVIFDVLEDISRYAKIDYEVVFVTAHSSFEYANKAINFACLDYITKPINSVKLDKVVKKALKQKQEQTSSDTQIKYLIEFLKGNLAVPSSISVSLPKGIIEIIELNRITYLKADENTCIFYFNNQTKLHSNKSFAHYIELLHSHPDFVQVSRNTLVNKNALKRYNHREKTIYLKNNSTIIVSHRYAKYFKEEITNIGLSGSLLDNMLDNLKKIFGGG